MFQGLVKINLIFFLAGENKKKDKKEDDSVNQNQANDVTDNGDGMSNGLVANVETEKIDIK